MTASEERLLAGPCITRIGGGSIPINVHDGPTPPYMPGAPRLLDEGDFRMSSPWARSASSPPVTFPPPATYTPGAPPPPSSGSNSARPPRRWPWAVAALLAVTVSIGMGSVITYMAMQGGKQAAPALSPLSSPTPSAPQFSSTEVATAKQHVCHAFEVSVGHESKGGFRVQGQLNVPSTLQSVSSAVAVQNALSPAVPPEVNAAARRYIDAILDVTTAAMGGTPTNEVNRLTDISNAALDALVDACGLPR